MLLLEARNQLAFLLRGGIIIVVMMVRPNGNAKMTIRDGVALPCKLLAPLLPLALLTMLKMLTLNTLLTLLTQCHTCLYIFLFGYSVSTFWSS